MSLDELILSNKADGEGATTPRRRSLSWLLPVGLLVGFLLVFYLLFGDRLVPALEVETAQLVTIRSSEASNPSLAPEAANSGEPQMLFQASGWVEPDPYTTFVPVLVSGVIEKMHVLEGQAVKQGELLAELVDDDAKLQLKGLVTKLDSLGKKILAHCVGFDITKAEIEIAKQKIQAQQSSLAKAIDEHDRLKQLKKGVVSSQRVVEAQLRVEQEQAMLSQAKLLIPRLQADLSKLEAETRAMEAEVDQVEVDQELAQLRLDRTKIHAPMNGTVLKLHGAPGMKRMLDGDAATSATVVELYDPMKLQARIDVALNEAAALHLDQAVELVSDFLPDQAFLGSVTRIKGQADLQRNTLQVKVEIADPDPRLRPGMLVRAKFFASNKPSDTQANNSPSSGRLSLYVPEKAIINDAQVWVIRADSTAELRDIQLGRQKREDHRLVLEGLRSGETVILSHHDQLEDGTRVTPKTQP